MVSTSFVHARSSACALNSFLRVGGLVSSPLFFMWLQAQSLSSCSFQKYFFLRSACSSVLSIMSTGSASARLVFSVPSVSSLDSESDACCLMPLLWTTSRSDSTSRTCNFANFDELPAGARNHLKCLWSLRIIKWLNHRYGSSDYTPRKTLWVAFSFFPALVGVGEHYPIGRVVPSSCCCNNTHPTCESSASVSTSY